MTIYHNKHTHFMTHYQTKSYLCVQKIVESCSWMLLYIYLNTKQIHGIKVLKIGSIIVPLPAHKTAVRLSCVLYTVSLTGGLIPQTPWVASLRSAVRQRHALRRAPAGAFSNTAPFVLATLTEIPSLVDSGCQRGKVSCFLPLEDIRIFLMFAV